MKWLFNHPIITFFEEQPWLLGSVTFHKYNYNHVHNIFLSMNFNILSREPTGLGVFNCLSNEHLWQQHETPSLQGSLLPLLEFLLPLLEFLLPLLRSLLLSDLLLQLLPVFNDLLQFLSPLLSLFFCLTATVRGRGGNVISHPELLGLLVLFGLLLPLLLLHPLNVLPLPLLPPLLPPLLRQGGGQGGPQLLPEVALALGLDPQG